MRSEEAKSLPIITKMPVIKPQVWQELRDEMDNGGDMYFWSLSANLVRENPQHRKALEKVLRDPSSSKGSDVTSATVLLVLRALDMQAKSDGYSLPQIPSPIDPLPALKEFFSRAQCNGESELIDIAYDELLKTNPVIGEIVEDISSGAPDELLRIVSVRQAKRGAMYAFYGVKSVIPSLNI